ncbi:hypothetical protein [Parabacteroides sp. PF5-6]|uniref:hypothetical protein n=1 Tax=Parabacteroides sp. PF5-6 TaxID=1742403 RepID=UPI0024063BB5|nr:hypothetical protein [Parabacteroides sp. PF5-6]MDF9831338.1 hypothetical protein [Parabacteroides sp. PF5-6]
MLEFIYIFEDEEGPYDMYIETAPICLKEVDGDWYMVGSGREHGIDIYSLKKIKAIGRHWITFSLPENIDYDRFAERYFEIEKVL